MRRVKGTGGGGGVLQSIPDLLPCYWRVVPSARMCRIADMPLKLGSGGWDHEGFTLGSVSMHCQASARTSISRGENETPSSLAIATTVM